MNIYEVLLLLVCCCCSCVIAARVLLLLVASVLSVRPSCILSKFSRSSFSSPTSFSFFPRPNGPPQRRIRELERSHAGLVGALDAKVAALQQADRQCAELRQQQAASDAEETKLRALLRVSEGWIRHEKGGGDQSLHT